MLSSFITDDSNIQVRGVTSGYAETVLQIKGVSAYGHESEYLYVTVYSGVEDVEIQGETNLECNQTTMYMVDPTLGNWDCQWTVTGPMTIIGNSNSYKINVQTDVSGVGYGQVSFSYTNRCGGDSDNLVFNVTCDQPMMYPNPASSEFTVDMSTFDESSSVLEEDYTIDVIDSGQNTTYLGKTKQKIKTFKTKDIAEGMVNVIIQFKGKIYSKTLMIQK